MLGNSSLLYVLIWVIAVTLEGLVFILCTRGHRKLSWRVNLRARSKSEKMEKIQIVEKKLNNLRVRQASMSGHTQKRYIQNEVNVLT